MRRRGPGRTLDVRELAAVDMHGAHGGPLRRRLIVAEFIIGAIGIPCLGAAFVFSGGLGDVVGAWLLGVGLNYVPLALHAIDLSRGHALQSELRGTDLPRALRRYTRAQFWVLVPLLLIASDLLTRRARA